MGKPVLYRQFEPHGGAHSSAQGIAQCYEAKDVNFYKTSCYDAFLLYFSVFLLSFSSFSCHDLVVFMPEAWQHVAGG
jgi:hypothetical protein